jgi:hypothetical protein
MLYGIVAAAIKDSPDFYILNEDEKAHRMEAKFAKDETGNSLFQSRIIGLSVGSRAEFSFTLESDNDLVEKQCSIAAHRLIGLLIEKLSKEGQK